jgi:FkbH-like protein
MPISREQVIAGFKFVLGRDPSNAAHQGAEEHIQRTMVTCKDEYELADGLFNCEEFFNSERCKKIVSIANDSSSNFVRPKKYSLHNGKHYHVPSDLRVGDTKHKNILLIGSCLSESLGARINQYLKDLKSNNKISHILVNNTSRLPAQPDLPISDYSFQIIQPPLRRIIHEGNYIRLDFKDLNALAELEERSIMLLDRFIENYMGYHTSHGLSTFITGFMVPQQNPLGRLMPKHDLSNIQHTVRRLNERIEIICRSRKNVHYVDIDEIASMIGKRHILDDSIGSISHGSVAGDYDYEHDRRRIHPPEPFSRHHELKTHEFLDAVWNDILSRYKTLTQQDPIKIVILDLDDTLWRGVLAEDGIAPNGLEGWPIGLLEAISFLKKRGILLAIASKNNEQLIREKWHEIFHGKLLMDDFASVKINWSPKPLNIREILDEVKLLPSNALFIDDNPAEREAVKQAFPDIRVLGEDLYYLRRILLWAPELQVPFITDESSKRTEMIQAQVVREHSRKSMSREEFLASLELQVDGMHINSPDHPDYERAVELLNKTNQFNTTGKRWSPEELGRFFVEGGVFHAFKVTDKFTAYGLVGLLLVQGNCIRQFVMSCRVVGLDVEQQMLRTVIDHMDDPELTAEYVKTEKNHLCTDLYAQNGFELRAGEGGWVHTKPEKKSLLQRILTS